jgi:putative ABC transport system permease protein
MGLGAEFGALNTMYTAVSSRTQEIATLRALGFRAGPVVISVVSESLLLALGIFFAMVIGLIGGLFPAIRAARQPIAHALRGL